MKKKFKKILKETQSTIDDTVNEMESKMDMKKIESKFKKNVSSSLDHLSSLVNADEPLNESSLTLDSKKEMLAEEIYNMLNDYDIDISELKSNEEFVNFATEEMVGRSVLQDAFENDEVEEIKCLSWDKIYITIDGTE